MAAEEIAVRGVDGPGDTGEMPGETTGDTGEEMLLDDETRLLEAAEGLGVARDAVAPPTPGDFIPTSTRTSSCSSGRSGR